MMKDDGWGKSVDYYETGTADTSRVLAAFSSAGGAASWDDDGGSSYSFWGGVAHWGISECVGLVIQSKITGGNWTNESLAPGGTATSDEIRFNIPSGDVDLNPPLYTNDKGTFVGSLTWDRRGISIVHQCTPTADMDVTTLYVAMCPFPNWAEYPDDFPNLVLFDGDTEEQDFVDATTQKDGALSARVRGGGNNTVYVVSGTDPLDGPTLRTMILRTPTSAALNKLYIGWVTGVQSYDIGELIDLQSRIEPVAINGHDWRKENYCWLTPR